MKICELLSLLLQDTQDNLKLFCINFDCSARDRETLTTLCNLLDHTLHRRNRDWAGSKTFIHHPPENNQ